VSVLFLKVVENNSNPPNFEVKIFNTSTFVAEKSVNIEAIIALFLSHLLNLACLWFSYTINNNAVTKLMNDTIAKMARL
jgi:hypothetical protein